MKRGFNSAILHLITNQFYFECSVFILGYFGKILIPDWATF